MRFMLPRPLAWIRKHGAKLDAAARRRMFTLYRPPGWMPCWLHGLWFWLVARLVRVPLILAVAEGDGSEVQSLLHEHGCRCTHELTALGYYCVQARVGAVAALCESNCISQVWLDRKVQAMLDKAVPAARAVKAVSRYKGAGVTIAVADTGIYPHPDFGGRIIAFADFVGRRTAPYDDNGHGTHVAGCAAGGGTRSGGRYRGPAPGALLVGVKVLDKVGSGQMSGLLAGIDWVIRNRDRYRIRILSLSLGAPAGRTCSADPLCRAVSAAWQAGITVIAAAGNSGPSRGTIASPGINPQVITVGAMDDQGTADRRDDALAAFSSRGPAPGGVVKPDLLAPGAAITATRSPGSYLDRQSPEARVGQWYQTLSGTSMATPIVAGIVALLLESRPELSPQQVKARLQATATDWGLLPTEQGAGYVDGDRLLGL